MLGLAVPSSYFNSNGDHCPGSPWAWPAAASQSKYWNCSFCPDQTHLLCQLMETAISYENHNCSCIWNLGLFLCPRSWAGQGEGTSAWQTDRRTGKAGKAPGQESGDELRGKRQRRGVFKPREAGESRNLPRFTLNPCSSPPAHCHLFLKNKTKQDDKIQ